jgi:DNA (cytosine-5)-methyltransferase 1
MKFGSLFSGIEAASVAWLPLGWQCAWVAEVDPFCRSLLKHHYPEVPNLGDVTKVDWDAVEPVDVIVGGAPCQDFSVAGQRAGLDGARGNLSVEFFRIVGRMRPRWVVFENVPGLLSMDEGRAFGLLLGLLAECGYGFSWRILDAQFSGVPQRRRRVFLVGYLGDWRPSAAVLFDEESLLGHPAPRRAAGQSIARPVTPGSPGDSGYRNDADTAENLVAFGGNNTAGPIDVATALSAHGGPHGRLDFESETFVTSFTGGASEIYAAEDVAQPVTGRNGDPSMIAFDTTQITSKLNRSVPRPSDPCHPLASTAHAPAVAFTISDPSNGFAWEKDYVGALEAHPQSETSNRQTGVRIGSTVRRLTPVEYERLQGFPDNYTQVPYRGKAASDGPRYKALGNSMAIPDMCWIGKRIQMMEEIKRSS